MCLRGRGWRGKGRKWERGGEGEGEEKGEGEGMRERARKREREREWERERERKGTRGAGECAGYTHRRGRDVVGRLFVAEKGEGKGGRGRRGRGRERDGESIEQEITLVFSFPLLML